MGRTTQEHLQNAVLLNRAYVEQCPGVTRAWEKFLLELDELKRRMYIDEVELPSFDSLYFLKLP